MVGGREWALTYNLLKYLSYILSFVISVDVCAQSLVDRIDTRVGTAASITRTAGMFGRGTEEYAHTLPAVLSPFGMNFWTPQTQWTEQKGVCPYLYKHDTMQGFRCSHWIVGGCTQDYGSFTVMPTSHRALGVAGSRFSHDDEVATPAYYALKMDDAGVKVEMTATQRAAIFRIQYLNPDSAYLFITVNSDEKQGGVRLESDGSIVGCNPAHRIYQGWGEPTGHSSHFLVRSNARIVESGRVGDNTLWVRFERTNEPVIVKASNSFCSADGARLNLVTEIPDWDFDLVRRRLTKTWEETLNKIEVMTDNDDDLLKFYGAMYHASFLPHDISDVDGSYPMFADGRVVKGEGRRPYYDDYSMWDTYRALHPLLILREPQRVGDMMRSLVMKYEQGGWMPIFPCWNSYTSAMIGDHCTSVLADAYVKGVRGFDIEKAYEGMRRNAFESPATYEEYCNGMGRRALKSYLQYGYVPLEDSVREAFHQHEQVSRTLEYAYDDYALAQVARLLGRKSDYKALIQRSKNYRNVFDPRTGWVNGRHADGSFATPADVQYIKEPEKHPEATSLTPFTFATFITEGVPAHYSWYVPHDVEGLIKCMGGRKAFEAKLDSMFERSYYWHGNEPCHHVAYMYDFVGRHDKCCRAVRHILDTEYLNAPGGLSGNDDAGQMSAWYIFSALGFYPVCPATPRYYLSCPVFRRADIKVGRNKRFTIVCNGSLAPYGRATSIRLNGKRLGRLYITHEEIMRGGVLEIE
ncbi:MAG: GH92 family glycosyl hydrolase [Bacteroidaceae bacterium]|nr:GH92 family glycosyl hydrolase [Bacteroidaceae bacterium]